MTPTRAGCWVVLAGLLVLAGCAHDHSTAPSVATGSSTATPVPTATATATSPTPPTVTPTAAFPVTKPTPTPAPTPTAIAVVITQADTGKTFTLPAGSAAELRLGSGLGWSTPMAAPPILAFTPETVPSGAGYRAWRVTTTGHGTAVVEATGAPVCLPGQVCAQFVVLFRVTVVVP